MEHVMVATNRYFVEMTYEMYNYFLLVYFFYLLYSLHYLLHDFKSNNGSHYPPPVFKAHIIVSHDINQYESYDIIANRYIAAKIELS